MDSGERLVTSHLDTPPVGAVSLSVPRGTPVRLVYSGGSAVMVGAEVLRAERDQLDLQLTDAEDIPMGARLIVELPSPAPPRAVAMVVGRSGNVLTTRVLRLPTVDRREYPRLWGIVDLRYRSADAEIVHAWMRGEDVDGPQHTPDARMDVSATGLGFEHGPCVSDGDRLLGTLSIPGEGGPWRWGGRVVRVSEIPARERRQNAQATHRIAMFFDAIPDEATAALVRYTARLQEDLLLGLAPRGQAVG
ncbi:MAG: hypothetical protein Q8P41_19550 [Pseudomonadota bacterium]|nr:hypothetical protein [Pseudomonadota bacterium]